MEYNFEKRYRLIREIIETVVLTVLMFVIINLAVQNYDVSGPSMEPSLHNQERIMVDKVSYLFHSPARGDVIVFIAPPAATAGNENFVKRIVAIPGDVITVNGTVVSVNGAPLKETYVAPEMQGNPNPPTNEVVPSDKYFVMGDDRRNSSDSRVWGFVPRGNIVGRAALVYWPFGQDNYGFLPNVSSVFADVHQPPSKAVVPQSGVQMNAASTTPPLSTIGNEGGFAIGRLKIVEMALGGAPALVLLFTVGRKRKSRHP